jgi:hypothetical protein
MAVDPGEMKMTSKQKIRAARLLVLPGAKELLVDKEKERRLRRLRKERTRREYERRCVEYEQRRIEQERKQAQESKQKELECSYVLLSSLLAWYVWTAAHRLLDLRCAGEFDGDKWVETSIEPVDSWSQKDLYAVIGGSYYAFRRDNILYKLNEGATFRTLLRDGFVGPSPSIDGLSSNYTCWFDGIIEIHDAVTSYISAGFNEAGYWRDDQYVILGKNGEFVVKPGFEDATEKLHSLVRKFVPSDVRITYMEANRINNSVSSWLRKYFP